jgi:hypothetical protein
MGHPPPSVAFALTMYPVEAIEYLSGQIEIYSSAVVRAFACVCGGGGEGGSDRVT